MSSRGSPSRSPTRTSCRWPALLTAIGLTEIYRLGPTTAAFRQGLWVVIGVAAFAATLIGLRRDYRVLERYKYLFGVRAIVLLFLPLAPRFGETVNGARLWVHAGGLTFQPGELGKVALIVFLAAYLREKREVLAQGRLKDWGPLLVIWGGAMLVLFVTNDLGSALLYYGIFLAMLYIATARLSFVARRARAVPRRRVLRRARDAARARAGHRLALPVDVAHGLLPARAGRWSLRQQCQSYQLVQSLYAIAHGGCGRHGPRPRHRSRRAAGTQIDPRPEHRLHLLRDRAGDRPRRRVAALLLVYMAFVAARLPDLARGERRLLEAPRRRPHLRLRAPDVRHRRRHPPRHPADGHHAAVRLVRRIERRVELPPAGRADAHLQPSEPRGRAREHAAPASRGRSRACSSRCSSARRRTGSRGRAAAREPAGERGAARRAAPGRTAARSTPRTARSSPGASRTRAAA